ncbi:UNKNOWN [Stylonychia lemnae]|uniref:Cyclic nucleotide-binding domain-containing protein n=1 Tax=Stylonychia lemnae TaxID=5949 RepID=A0A077ZSB0_STYLE|nr:UNKNOWN [Stylonychia lemnae]|eukprot:CDW72778.1 UNKNOWN [Stylonychia lemnae]
MSYSQYKSQTNAINLPTQMHHSAGFKKAYQKFQFYNQNSLNVEKYYGSVSKFKRMESDLHFSQSNQNAGLSNTTLSLGNLLDFNNTNIISQQITQNKNGADLSNTNFISPRILEKIRVDQQQKRKSKDYQLDQITSTINADGTRTLMIKRLLKDNPKLLATYKTLTSTQSQLKKEQSNSNIGSSNGLAGRSQSVLFKSQSTKALFKPPPSIKEILIGMNESEMKIHQDLLRKFSQTASTFNDRENSNEQKNSTVYEDKYTEYLSLPAIITRPSLVQDEILASQTQSLQNERLEDDRPEDEYMTYEGNDKVLELEENNDLEERLQGFNKKKLLKKIQEQIQHRTQKYRNANNLRTSFNLTEATGTAAINDQAGPYLNRSLKKRHNSVKKMLREKTQSNLRANKLDKNQDQDITQTLSEFINTSKNLEVKIKENQATDKNNNLSKIMEKSRSSKNSPGKKSMINLVHMEQDMSGHDSHQNDPDFAIKQESHKFMLALTETFNQQMIENEFDQIYKVFQKTAQERSSAEDEQAIDYLQTVTIFKEFPRNLLKEISKKFTTLFQQRNEIIKYKNDDTYQILIKGKIMKIDPKSSFKQSKVLLNSLFDPSEYLQNSSILVIKQPSYLLSINKKDFSKCIKIAALRSGEEDDIQFLAKRKFFNKIDKECLQKVCNLMVPRLFEEGKKIYDIGDVSEEMFIVRSGNVSEEVMVNSNQNGYFEFAQYQTGDWFGQSEMMLCETRKSRITATQSTLLLCIRRSELQQVLGFEYIELLKMHIFDHEDLKTRMIEVSKNKAEQEGVLKRYKHFNEDDMD